MKHIHFFYLLIGLLFLFPTMGSAAEKPNVVIIYADDMGWGDLNCQNPESRIPTPYLDALAGEGMRFTDAHSSSGICTPSRFALLTGQYHWRRQHEIVESFGAPIFRDGDVTLPQILKENGYRTACIGKWHLGWNWNFKNEPSAERLMWGKMRPVYMPEDIDWNSPLSGGPLDRGFDYYFGDGTINYPPYAWVENDQFVKAPNAFLERGGFHHQTGEGNFGSRPGPMVDGWDPYEVLPTLTKKSVEWIRSQKRGNPFFLYFALPSPHDPVVPNKEFRGKTEAGEYGDFMFQTDWVAGQLLQALKDAGLDENTLVIFSSDNGAEVNAYRRAKDTGHYSSALFRGVKRDVWEGGHRVPFIIKWPGRIKAGAVNDEVVSQIDLMATLASITGSSLPNGAAPDSYDLSPLFFGKDCSTPLREATVQNTFAEHYGIRKDNWFYINKPTGSVSQVPEWYNEFAGYTDFETPGLLFDMEKDPGQRHNLYNELPETAAAMQALLSKYLEQDASVKRD